MMQHGEDEKHFRALVSNLSTASQLLEPAEARHLYQYAQNYCIRQINRGKKNFSHELFALYQAQLENGLIFSNGFLHHLDFKNIVSTAIQSGDLSWTEQFIHQYKNKIPAGDRKNTFSYSLASLYFEQGKTDQVIKLLNQVSFNDINYQISGRYLLLKTYYETHQSEALRYAIRAFRRISNETKLFRPPSVKTI